MRFFTKSQMLCWLLLGCIAVACFISYTTNPKPQRVLLYFQRIDGKTVGTEERYLPQDTAYDFPVALVEDILLGPVNHEFLRFADPDLLPHSCFVRKGILYIDLPARVLSPKVKVPDFETVYRLLQKNIFTNCKDIREIYLYIDGTPVKAYI